MSSIFNNYTQHRVFMVYGNLGDMFIAGDLIPGKFEYFFMKYLKSIGFENVVFFAPDDRGRFVLDEESARFLAGTSASSLGLESLGKERRMSGAFGRRKGRELKIENDKVPEDNAETKTELRYKNRGTTVSDFLAMAQDYMNGKRGKTAVVVTNLQTFLNARPDPKYQALLTGEWAQYTKNEDAGAFIFLAPNASACSIQRMLGGMPFLADYFFEGGSSQGETIRTDRTLYIGEPQKDEIRNLLKYMCIAGFSYRKRKLYLFMDKEEMEQIVDSIYQCSCNRELYPHNRDLSQLSGIFDYLAEYVYLHCKEHAMAKGIRFGREQARQLFCNSGEDYNSTALEKLHKTGWEPVYQRVKEIVGVTEKRQEKRGPKSVGEPELVFEESEAKQETEENTVPFCGSKRIDPELGKEISQNQQSRPDIPSFVLKGNPGVGKTTVARLIAAVLYEAGILRTSRTVEVTRKDLVGSVIGGTEANMKDYIAKAEEGVLFIDEAYELFSGEGNDRDFGKHVVDALLPILDKKNTTHHICVILAGYPHEIDRLLQMNPGIASRIGKNDLVIPDATPEMMTEKFLEFIREDGYVLPDKDSENAIDIEEFFRNVYKHRNTRTFGNYRMVREIAESVTGNAMLRETRGNEICKEDFREYLKYFETQGVKTAGEALKQMDKFVGMEAVKKKLLQVQDDVELEQEHKKEGIQTIATEKHYIFSGNPGTGKTTVGKIMGQLFYALGALGAEETKFVDGSELIGSGYTGQGTDRAKRIIQDAIDNRQLLFIDEAYQIMDTGYRDEIMGAFLNPLTEHAADFKVVFALYSNRVEEFLQLNAGNSRRFEIIEFPDYTAKQLLEIFENKRKEIGRSITKEALQQVKEILEYLYDHRKEGFGNAAVPLDLLNDMERNRYRRIRRGMEEYENSRELIAEDIPEKMRGMKYGTDI